jgi:hypothetical protein
MTSLRVIGIQSIAPASQWWKRVRVHRRGQPPARDREFCFELVACFATLRVVKDEGEVVVLYCLSGHEISALNFRVLNNESWHIEEDELDFDLFHETDFDVVGEKLKPGARSRSKD